MAEAVSAVAGEEQVADAKKKGTSLWVVIVACTLAVSAVAGGAVYLFAGQAAGESAVQEKGEVAKAKPKGPALYIKLDPPFVVNFESSGLMRFLQISVEVLTRDQATADLLRMHDAKIRNELLMLFGSQQQGTLTDRTSKEQLRMDALKAVAGVIESEGGVGSNLESLYFTSFVMQ